MSNGDLLKLLLPYTTLNNVSIIFYKISSQESKKQASAMDILKVEYTISRLA